MNEKGLERLKQKYPAGTRIKLLKEIIDEFSNLYEGATGTVQFVDDAGNINMQWDNGSTLSLIDYEDSFEILSRPEKIKVIVAEPKKERRKKFPRSLCSNARHLYDREKFPSRSEVDANTPSVLMLLPPIKGAIVTILGICYHV